MKIILLATLGPILLTQISLGQPLVWEQRFAPRNLFLGEAVFANGRFVAVGDNGAIATSRDGRVWTPGVAGTDGAFSAITYGNGLYVAGGDDDEGEGPNLLITSPDARNWTVRELPPVGRVYALAYGAGRFVAITYHSRLATVFTSSDGTSWDATAVLTNVFVWKLIFAGGMFVGAGVDYSGVNIAPAIVTSSDGGNWTQQVIPTFWGFLSGLTYGKGQFVAVGWPGAILRSADGTHWTHQSVGTNTLRGVAYGGGLFVAVGYTDDGNPSVGFYRYSRDGQRWFGRSFGSSPYFFSSITYGGGSFIALQGYQGFMDKPKTRVLRGTPVNERAQDRPKPFRWRTIGPFLRP